MRKIFLICLFITLSVLLQVKAVSDCTVVPASYPDATWCIDCGSGTKTDNYCSFCQPSSIYAKLDGSSCTYINCSSPSQIDNQYCFNCESTNKYYSPYLQKCISYNCGQTVYPLTKDYCQYCYNNYYPSNDGSYCSSFDCSITPSPLTETYCKSCEYPTNKVSAKDNKCVGVDCNKKPIAGNFTDDWCYNCQIPSVFALENKNGCATPDTFSATTTTTTCVSSYGSILTVLSTIFILIIFV